MKTNYLLWRTALIVQVLWTNFNSAWISYMWAVEGVNVFGFNEEVVQHLDQKADN